MKKSRVIVALSAVLVPLASLANPAPAFAASVIDTGGNGTNVSWTTYLSERLPQGKQIAYRDSVSNGRNTAISATCSATTSKTFSWSVGGSVSTEIKAGIFGGAKAEVNGSIQRDVTTGYTTSASFRVPANSVVSCERGVVTERLSGYTKINSCGGGCSTTTQNWSFQAPETARWWIY